MTSMPVHSIIIKLGQIDPAAPTWIFTRSDNVRRQREAIEEKGLVRSFWSAAVAPFYCVTGESPLPSRNEGRFWESHDNDRRKACRDYLDSHPDVAEQLFLSQNERDSLDSFGDKRDIYDQIKGPLFGCNSRTPDTRSRRLSL